VKSVKVSPQDPGFAGSVRGGVTDSTERYRYDASSVVGRWAALVFVGFVIALDVGELVSAFAGIDLDLPRIPYNPRSGRGVVLVREGGFEPGATHARHA
jgi:hypothetical protein